MNSRSSWVQKLNWKCMLKQDMLLVKTYANWPCCDTFYLSWWLLIVELIEICENPNTGIYWLHCKWSSHKGNTSIYRGHLIWLSSQNLINHKLQSPQILSCSYTIIWRLWTVEQILMNNLTCIYKAVCYVCIPIHYGYLFMFTANV